MASPVPTQTMSLFDGATATADLQAKRDALAKDIADLAGTFVNDLATWINDSGIVVGQPLTAEQQQAFRWKSAEDMVIAQEYIDQGGDYQRALDIYNQSLAQDPENPDPLGMPLQFMVTSEAVARGHRYADKARKVMFNPVGQIVGRMNAVQPVKDVMYQLVQEYVESVERLQALTAE